MGNPMNWFTCILCRIPWIISFIDLLIARFLSLGPCDRMHFEHLNNPIAPEVRIHGRCECSNCPSCIRFGTAYGILDLNHSMWWHNRDVEPVNVLCIHWNKCPIHIKYSLSHQSIENKINWIYQPFKISNRIPNRSISFPPTFGMSIVNPV